MDTKQNEIKGLTIELKLKGYKKTKKRLKKLIKLAKRATKSLDALEQNELLPNYIPADKDEEFNIYMNDEVVGKFYKDIFEEEQ